jgi:hypothetical protein
MSDTKMGEYQGASPRFTIGDRAKSSPFYDPPLAEVKPEVRALLEEYAAIPAEDVLSRIMEAVSSSPDKTDRFLLRFSLVQGNCC